MLNTRTAALALAALAMPVFGHQPQSQLPDEPMKLKTELTVYASPLPRNDSEADNDKNSRRGNRVRSGAGKTLRGFGNAAGWMMNVDDDIPSRRSRRAPKSDMPDVQSLTNSSFVR